MGPELWHNELADDTSAAYSNEEVYSQESSEHVKVYFFYFLCFKPFSNI